MCGLHAYRFTYIWVHTVSYMWGPKADAQHDFTVLLPYSRCRISQSNPVFAGLLQSSTFWGLELKASDHCCQAIAQL